MGGEHSLNILAPQLSRFVIYDIWKFWGKGLLTDSLTELIMKVFVEHARYTMSVNTITDNLFSFFSCPEAALEV